MKTALAIIGRNRIEILGTPIEKLMTERSLPSLLLEFAGVSPVRAGTERLIEMMMVGFCDHGLSPPSTMCARLAASCGADLSKSLIAALATMGDTHVPIVEACAFFRRVHMRGVGFAATYDRAPGFGHPIHSEDPRVSVLLAEAAAIGLSLEYCRLAQAIEKRIGVRLNYAGAVAAIACDMNLSPYFAQLIAIMGRLVGLTAHAQEQIKMAKRVICYDEADQRFRD